MEENKSQKTASFALPVMIDILKGLGIKATVQELKNLKPEKLLEIYRNLVKLILALEQTVFETMPVEVSLNFTEEILNVQSNSFKLLLIYSLLCYLFDMCGLNACFSEMFFPSNKLFVKQMNAIINFAKFAFAELPVFSEILSEFKVHQENTKQLIQESDEYKTKTIYLKEEKLQKKPLIDNAKKRIQALNDRINMINERKKKLDSEFDKLSKEESNLAAEIAEKKNILSNNQKRSTFYDKVLIKSPEKLKNDIQKNQAKIIDMGQLIKSKKKENDDIQLTLNDRDRFIEDLKPMKESIQLFINTDVEAANKLIKEIEKTKENITTGEFNRNQKVSLLTTSGKELEKLAAEYDAYCKEIEQILMQLKEKDDNYQNLIKKDRNEIRDLEKEKMLVKEEISKIREATKILMDKKFDEIKTNEQMREFLQSQTNTREKHMVKEMEAMSLTSDTVLRLVPEYDETSKMVKQMFRY